MSKNVNPLLTFLEMLVINNLTPDLTSFAVVLEINSTEFRYEMGMNIENPLLELKFRGAEDRFVTIF